MSSTRSNSARTISAMVRVRDEEQFLEVAIRSIADLVDEIVIVDNLSSDKSPQIIDALWKELPGRVRPYHYPHEIRRVGRENWELSDREPDSPNLSSSYYNWCLARCTCPWVLKWDGDMIALDVFADSLERWRVSDREVLVIQGANVHPDFEHLIAARTDSREELLERLSVKGLPAWVASLTLDYPEPRLFPKAGARYTNRIRWTQGFESSALDGKNVLRAADPQYLHMKFCKRDPYANYTDDLAEVIASNVVVGPPLALAMRETLRHWQVEGRR